MDQRISAAGHDFLLGGGEMGALMRSYVWERTPLGPPEAWPQSLRSAISILLPSRAQICLFWGPELITLYNDAYRPALGVKHPWALGQPAREVWKEFWEDVLRPLLTRVVETGDAFRGDDYPFFLERHGYPEETYFDISYDPVREESGRVGGVFCIVCETTGRVVGERRLRTLRDVSRVAGEATDTKEAFERVAAVLQLDALDLPFVLFYEGDAAATKYVAGYGIEGLEHHPWPFARAATRRTEIVLQDSDLPLGPLSGGPWPEPTKTIVLLPLLSSAQEPLGFLVVGTSSRRALDGPYLDFLRMIASNTAAAVGTARALAEERARAQALADLDRAKTLFFSNISHEFRTPLTLMLGPVEDMLQDEGRQLSPADQQRLEIAHRNAQRLLRLVNALLDFSRIEAGRIRAAFQRTDIAQFTAELASNFRAATDSAGLKLVVDCPPLSVPLYVDREMWEQIVLNLISNAFKFTFAGDITVRIAECEDHAELTVSDTGTGIPPDQLPRVFERFHRVEGARGRSVEGSGIGLALVQELVKLHGGTIAVASTFGKGSTFTVRVPLGREHLPAEHVVSESASSRAGARAQAYVEEALRWLPNRAPGAVSAGLAGDILSQVPAAANGRRVLVADDNSDMRGYVRRLLMTQGYEVEAVTDGEAALAAAAERPPDLVLADVMMPRLDGFALLQRLRRDPHTEDIPVIILSARAGEEAKVEGLKAGADDYLIKPFSARELFARIDSAIALRALRREAAQALREENARIRSWFDQAPGFIAILNGPDHRLEFVNQAYRRLVGDRELIGRCVREAFPEVATQGYLDLLDQVYRTGRRFVGEEMPIRLDIPGDGTRDLFLDFIYEPITTPDGKVTGIFVEGHDVTGRIAAQSELRESEARFRTMADNMPTLCWMARPDGHIFWYNSRWYEYTGTRPNEMEGWGWQSVHDPKVLPEVLRRWQHSLATGENFEMTFPLRGADGILRPFLTRIVAAKDEAGIVVRWFGTNTDVSAQRRYEEQLQLLVNELNHRVKNTLTVVNSLAAQTMRNAADLTSARDAFEARLFALSAAHDLLTHGSWKGADIRNLFAAVLAPFVARAADRTRIGGPSLLLPPQPVLTLTMALHELATNATKYGALSNEAGSVDISWTVNSADKLLKIVWRETDGPPVATPSKRGFGSRLIERELASDLQGTVDLSFAPAGVICTIECPLFNEPHDHEFIEPGAFGAAGVDATGEPPAPISAPSPGLRRGSNRGLTAIE